MITAKISSLHQSFKFDHKQNKYTVTESHISRLQSTIQLLEEDKAKQCEQLRQKEIRLNQSYDKLETLRSELEWVKTRAIERVETLTNLVEQKQVRIIMLESKVHELTTENGSLKQKLSQMEM